MNAGSAQRFRLHPARLDWDGAHHNERRASRKHFDGARAACVGPEQNFVHDVAGAEHDDRHVCCRKRIPQRCSAAYARGC
jgi:hypothetical protein